MSQVKEMNQIFKIFAFIFCIFCSFPYFSPAEAKDITIRFDGSKMSADIDGALLKDVFEKIKAQRKFSVKGDDSILNSEVSVSFTNLAFQDGLKKILVHINHILFFNKNKEPSGVFIVGSGGSRISTGKARLDKKRMKTVPNDKKYGMPIAPGNKYSGPTPASDMTPPTEEELANMKIIHDAPTPGGPVEVSEQDMENLKIEKSNTPPGGVVKVTPEELESMQPASNSQSMPTPGINKE